MSRRFQFSVQTLLWLTAVLAAFLAGTPLDRYLAERRADPSETKVRAALNDVTEMDFKDAPLEDVVEYLGRRHNINIELDYKALADSGIATDTPVSRKVEGIMLRSALPLVLNDIFLTYVVQNGVLLITSKTEAGAMPTASPPLFNLRTILWLVVVVAAFAVGVQVGRKRTATAPLL